jgi:hypothetical protein
VAFQRKKRTAIGVRSPDSSRLMSHRRSAGFAKDPRWIHETKFDGYRVRAHQRSGQGPSPAAGHDWTKCFKRFAVTRGTSAPDPRLSTARPYEQLAA